MLPSAEETIRGRTCGIHSLNFYKQALKSAIPSKLCRVIADGTANTSKGIQGDSRRVGGHHTQAHNPDRPERLPRCLRQCSDGP